jgi:hypothetical protein
MKIQILHHVFGSINVDEEGNISVRKPDLAERLTRLLHHFDELPGVAHYNAGVTGDLIAVMEYLGITRESPK